MKKDTSSSSFAMILEHVPHGSSEAVAVPFSDTPPSRDWHEDHAEGKLSVDVAHDERMVYVVSTVAGAIPDRIEVYVHHDMLTIRGERINPIRELSDIEFYHQECFWGSFSRTIVLPVEVNADLSRARYKNGILEISIPKRKFDGKISIEIIEE